MKLQIPNPKSQTSSKLQTPMEKETLRFSSGASKGPNASFEIWNLDFVWDWEFGIWNF